MAFDPDDYKIVKAIKDEISTQNKLIKNQNQILIDLVEQLKYLRWDYGIW